MACFLHQFNTFTFRGKRHFLLVMSWIAGLGFGGLVFSYGKDHLVSLMPLVFSSQLSIMGLCASALLPYLFSVFAVYLSIPWMLIPICFAKAFLFSYMTCGVYQVFGGAGWLLHWLLLFVDTMSIPVLYLYWLRHISGFRSFCPGVTMVYLTVLVSIVILGNMFISPLFGALSF